MECDLTNLLSSRKLTLDQWNNAALAALGSSSEGTLMIRDCITFLFYKATVRVLEQGEDRDD